MKHVAKGILTCSVNVNDYTNKYPNFYILPYDPSCPSVGRFVGRSVGWLAGSFVSHNFLKEWEGTFSFLLEHLVIKKDSKKAAALKPKPKRITDNGRCPIILASINSRIMLRLYESRL